MRCSSYRIGITLWPMTANPRWSLLHVSCTVAAACIGALLKSIYFGGRKTVRYCSQMANRYPRPDNIW